ncbi:MAG: 3-isopropylmalate dehydratase [Candidatus Methylomirabilales bacterium]
MEAIRGRTFRVGDAVNTDYIIPARYLDVYEPEALAAHVFEGLGPDYPDRVRGCTVLLAGENFGLGSAREQAPNALKGAGFRAVLAASVARTFFRNAINVGLAVVCCPAAVRAIAAGDEVCLDLEAGRIQAAGNRTFAFQPLPPPLGRILAAGGMAALLGRRPATPPPAAGAPWD